MSTARHACNDGYRNQKDANPFHVYEPSSGTMQIAKDMLRRLSTVSIDKPGALVSHQYQDARECRQ